MPLFQPKDVWFPIGFILTSMTLKKTIGMNAIVESKILANSGEIVFHFPHKSCHLFTQSPWANSFQQMRTLEQ